MTRRMLWTLQTSEGPCDVWVWAWPAPRDNPPWVTVRAECEVGGHRFRGYYPSRREHADEHALQDYVAVMVDRLRAKGITVTDGEQVLP